MPPQRRTGLPGLRSADHIGITVPNLEDATTFLVDVIGCEYLYSLGPFKSDDTWMSDHLGIHRDAVMRELRFFRCGNGTQLEVFEYEAPEQRTAIPLNSDVGGHHIAFYVDDLDVAIAHLRAHDVELLGEPTASSGASEGQRWIYFRAPWGLQMELVSFPNGKAVDRVPQH